MVIKTILLSRFTETMGQREGYSRGVQTGHRDFPGYAFTLTDENSNEIRLTQEKPEWSIAFGN